MSHRGVHVVGIQVEYNYKKHKVIHHHLIKAVDFLLQSPLLPIIHVTINFIIYFITKMDIGIIGGGIAGKISPQTMQTSQA